MPDILSVDAYPALIGGLWDRAAGRPEIGKQQAPCYYAAFDDRIVANRLMAQA